MVRRNVVALLHAVGKEMIDKTTTATTTTTTVAASSMPFLGATAGKIGRAYRRRLQGDLRRHAADMGHDVTRRRWWRGWDAAGCRTPRAAEAWLGVVDEAFVIARVEESLVECDGMM